MKFLTVAFKGVLALVVCLSALVMVAVPDSSAEPTCVEGVLVDGACVITGSPPVNGPSVCPDSPIVFEDENGCYRLVEQVRVDIVCPDFTTPDPNEPFCRRPVDLRPGPLICAEGFTLVDGQCLRYDEPVYDLTCSEGVLDNDICVITGAPPVNGPAICPVSDTVIQDGNECYILVGTLGDGSCPAGTTPDPSSGLCRRAVDLQPGPLVCAEGFELVEGQCLRYEAPVQSGNPTCVEGALVLEDLECVVTGAAPVNGPAICPALQDGNECYTLVAPVSVEFACPNGTTPQDELCRLPVERVLGPKICEAGFDLVGDQCLRYETPCSSATVVSTAAELDYAIGCYNAQAPAGDHAITLGADIAHPNGVATINSISDAVALTIDGAGRSVTGPGSTNNNDLFRIENSGATTNFLDITIGGAGRYTMNVIDGSVVVSNATISNSGSVGVGVLAGSVVVSNSTLSDNGTGVVVSGGSVVVSNSTVAASTNFGVRASGGSVVVSNSTVMNSKTGVSVSGASVSVSVTSSIVSGNSTADCAGSVAVVDGGNNFDSDESCTGFGTLSAGSLGVLADNGGSTETVSLSASSNAVDAGDCTGVVIGLDGAGTQIVGDLAFDQRGPGFPRTVGLACDAGAYEAASCSSASPTVSSADELDVAIDCYNAQTPVGDHTITFGADIVHAGGTPTVTQNDANHQLIVNGADYRLTGPGGNSLGRTVSLLTVDGAGPVRLNEHTLGGADQSAVRVLSGTVTIADTWIEDNGWSGVFVSGGEVSIVNSTIVDNSIDFGVRVEAGSLTATNTLIANNNHGMYSDGSVNMVNSSVTANELGVVAQSGSMSISDSTIASNTAAGIGAISGSLSISNSTIAANPANGVVVNGAAVSISNSTIADNTNGVEFVSGTVTVVSSIVSGNTTADCTGTVVDGGNNFVGDGSCGGFTALSAGSLGALAENGCDAPGPSGCVRTNALLATSNAVGGGTCAAVVVAADPAGGSNFVTGDLAFDQRGDGFPRTVGAECDAGAYEADLCTTATPTVTTAGELDVAIACYNAQTPVGDHTITFGADITHPSQPPIIDSTTDDGDLAIDGAGYTLDGPGPIENEFVDLLQIDNPAVRTAIMNLTLRNADGYAVDLSAGSLSLTVMRIVDNWNGVKVGDGSTSIADSTIANNARDGVVIGSGQKWVTISNSTITGNGSEAVLHNSGPLWIANSTIVDNGQGVATYGGSVSVVSSILADNGADCVVSVNADPIVNGGGNFDSDGTCAGFTALSAGSLGVLADNGGPTETVALSAGSNAVDAGVCAGVVLGVDAAGTPIVGDLEFDQRGAGFTRTFGDGCDSGAFEDDTPACRPGSYSETGFDPCILAPTGTFVPDAKARESTPCPVGSYSDVVGAEFCKPAPLGSFVAVSGAEVATPCAAGSFSDVVGAEECELAPVGSFVPGERAEEPTPCPAGSFSDVVGAVECTLAPLGSFVPVSGAEAATPCAAGSFSDVVGAEECELAPVGSFVPTEGATEATPCPPGSSTDAEGAIECMLNAAGYVALNPVRILDTRNATQGDFDSPWGEGETRPVQVTGVGGVPASGVEAVVLHVTTVDPSAEFSWLTVSPTGSVPGVTAVHNFGTAPFSAEIVNDVIIAKVGVGGTIDVRNENGEVELVFDVVGYYSSDAGFGYVPLAPARILDTRNDLEGDFDTPWGEGQTRQVQVTGVGGVPASGVEAVAVNVTTVSPSAEFSWLTVSPTGVTPSTTAAHNFGTASYSTEIVNDVIIAKVGVGGTIDVRNENGEVDLVFDVVGYYASSGGFGYEPLNPTRILDTRNNVEGDFDTPWGVGQSRTVETTFGACADAVVLHVTTVSPSAGFSWLTITPAGEAPSTTAAHNFGTAAFTTEIRNDIVIAKTGTGGDIDIFNQDGTVDLVIDLVGAYGTDDCP